MNLVVEALVRHLHTQDWSVDEFKSPVAQNPDGISFHSSYLPFLAQIQRCVSSDSTVWFNYVPKYEGKTESAFAWDEWRRLSLSVATVENEEIAQFWQGHVPIINSVREGFYAYFALESTVGRVWYGEEPLFEEAQLVAASFGEFVQLLVKNRLAPFYQKLFLT